MLAEAEAARGGTRGRDVPPIAPRLKEAARRGMAGAIRVVGQGRWLAAAARRARIGGALRLWARTQARAAEPAELACDEAETRGDGIALLCSLISRADFSHQYCVVHREFRERKTIAWRVGKGAQAEGCCANSSENLQGRWGGLHKAWWNRSGARARRAESLACCADPVSARTCSRGNTARSAPSSPTSREIPARAAPRRSQHKLLIYSDAALLGQSRTCVRMIRHIAMNPMYPATI